ncbi:unnamed protein product [Arctia plantaginis]|uniref:Defensin n=1 Tax=Arctia plantaginis TaxID=874455 RepID=A0A8S0ZBN4_ARCPL|nr:unnamed protein product [Arctia plantaginis]CAB3256765.1 unnamed protein product [Arctia plantaginis]
MKLLTFLFALIIIAHLAKGAAVRYTLRDLLEESEKHKSLETNSIATQSLHVTATLRDCSNPTCDAICKALGFDHGACESASICHCYN